MAGISLLLVLLALWSHGQEVLALAPDQRGWALLVFGLALTVVAQWANGLAWWALLRWLQLPLPLLEMVQLFVRTNLLKYLPGWHLAPGGPGAVVAPAGSLWAPGAAVGVA